jgi:hypothetical protein
VTVKLARIDPDTAGRTFADKQDDDDWEITGVSPEGVKRRTFRWQPRAAVQRGRHTCLTGMVFRLAAVAPGAERTG